MRRGDAITLGRLMNESHISLRDDFQVSSPELNAMAEIAQRQEGCFGARMTGAGFGGCAVALVERDAASAFSTALAAEYRDATGLQPNLYVSPPAGGAATFDFVEAVP